MGVVAVLLMGVLIMSGMGWGGAQSHWRHADNKVLRVRSNSGQNAHTVRVIQNKINPLMKMRVILL